MSQSPQVPPGASTPSGSRIPPGTALPSGTEITLVLSLDETNLVLEALGQLPFVRVYEFIAKIQAQAQAQLASGEAEPTERTNG